VAGYGSEEPRLKQMATSGVRFVGRVQPAEMPSLFDVADVFVNASVVDNQPVSILEAFASGLPVISTPAGDIPSMVRHEETGLLVPPASPDAMAAAIVQTLERPERALQMARQAREELQRYTWPAVRDAWMSIYSRQHAAALDHVAVNSQ